jgi:hypothetical protein
MKRAFTLTTETTLKALENFERGVWEPRGELSPTGSIDVYHTVTQERFRVLLTDYIHTNPEDHHG